jgi:single-stranded-DNA-specific exonuclease
MTDISTRPNSESPKLESGSYLGVDRSVTGRKWLARPLDESVVAAIARQQQIPDTLARVVAGRGVSADMAGRYLAPRLRDEFPDPSTFRDMDKAAALIWDALEAKKSLAVFADYDVDGATSAAQLIRWAAAVGHALHLYVPDRVKEGYGPTKEAFQALKDIGSELVITVDCGATTMDAVTHANKINLDVIVVDHHLMSDDCPPAAALINPNHPDDTSACGHMAAAGVTFVLLVALNREGRRRGLLTSETEPDLLQLIDLAALGTICDVVPLTGVNRALVAQGLKAMSDWHHPGLRQLAEIAGASGPATTYHAGYQLGPRINAGGRVGLAELGTRLLVTEDEDNARDLASQLDHFNTERRAIESDVMDEARAQLQAQVADRSVLVASGRGWHAGVIGIVAGRLKDTFGKPVILIAIDETGSKPVGKGSGRSVPGVNLGAAISAARKEGLLLSGGGHAMAGGLSVDADRITELVAFLDDALAPQLQTATDAMALKLDGILTPAGTDIELIEMLEMAGPYGQGNAQPRFALCDLRIAFAQRVGVDHVRFTLEDDNAQRLSGICFGCADGPIGEALLAADGRKWHAAGKIKIDTWQGRKRIQLHLEDLAAVDR